MTDGVDGSEDDPQESTVFVSAAARRTAVLRLLALASLAVGLAVGFRLAVPGVTDPTWVRARIAALDAVGPIAFVGIQAAQVVLAPVPGQMLGGVGGYLFGTVLGTVFSMLGVTIGSGLVFLGTRRYGRPAVERLVVEDALDRWDGFVDRTGVPGLFVLFLLPTFPDDVLCFVAGLTEIRARTFLLLVVVGRTPSFLAVAYAGTRYSGGDAVEVVAVVLALTGVSILTYVARERILSRLGSV